MSPFFLSPFAVLLHLFSALPLQGPGGGLGAGYFRGLVYLGVVFFNGVVVFWGQKRFLSHPFPFSSLEGVMVFSALVADWYNVSA